MCTLMKKIGIPVYYSLLNIRLRCFSESPSFDVEGSVKRLNKEGSETNKINTNKIFYRHLWKSE